MQLSLRNLLVLGLLPSLCTIAAGQLTAPFSSQDAIDVLEIQQMVNLYATAFDQKRFDLLPQIFTPDVTVNLPGVPLLRGLRAVTNFMAAALRDVKSHHAQSTHYINLTDTAAPWATTYNSATFFAGEQPRQQVYTRLGRVTLEMHWLLQEKRQSPRFDSIARKGLKTAFKAIMENLNVATFPLVEQTKS